VQSGPGIAEKKIFRRKRYSLAATWQDTSGLLFDRRKGARRHVGDLFLPRRVLRLELNLELASGAPAQALVGEQR